MRHRAPLTAVLLCAGALAAPVLPAVEDAAEAERDLAELRARIESLERDLAERRARRGATEARLREAETAAAAARRRVDRLHAERAAAESRRAELGARADAERLALEAEIEGLGTQLRLVWVEGREQWLRLVLSARSPSGIGRRDVYYRYLARARGRRVESVRERLAALERTTAELEQEEARLQALEQSERARLGEWSAARDARRLALARLDEEISSRSGEIARYQTQAEELARLVRELTEMLASLPVRGGEAFAGTKGRLDWPADGRLERRFGDKRADGRLKWNGVLLAAPAGTEVRAIHHGRVIFSDWLTGMGLLLILEHGGGYLSLYGHNQDLTRDVGEWVEPGDLIAHVGDSGGRMSSGLYFEVRKDGRPVDPADWIRR